MDAVAEGEERGLSAVEGGSGGGLQVHYPSLLPLPRRTGHLGITHLAKDPLINGYLSSFGMAQFRLQLGKPNCVGLSPSGYTPVIFGSPVTTRRDHFSHRTAISPCCYL